MIRVDGTAPVWAQKLARDAQDEINLTNLFVSRTPFTVAGLSTVSAADNTNKLALLSDGTFWLAKSNGTAWLYPDNSAV